ncbi:MAG TPA: pilus assembly protein PilB, partial [Candidatus Eisenbacteria bacterium]|nr:pilus assembly protein PilB [Candidatus Eisenbacteria bacterium]
MAPAEAQPLGRLLVARGVASEEQVKWALAQQKQTGALLGEILVEARLLPEADLTRALGEHLALDVVDLHRVRSDDAALSLISEGYAMEHLVLPLSLDENVLRVATADPANLPLLAEIRVMTRREVQAALAPKSQLETAIRERYKVLPGVAEFVKAYEQQDTRRAAMPVELAALAENAPVVQIVNLLITQGLRDRASDVHIEPKKDHVRIRYRIDGVLTEALRLPIALAPAIASRI